MGIAIESLGSQLWFGLGLGDYHSLGYLLCCDATCQCKMHDIFSLIFSSVSAAA